MQYNIFKDEHTGGWRVEFRFPGGQWEKRYFGTQAEAQNYYYAIRGCA